MWWGFIFDGVDGIKFQAKKKKINSQGVICSEASEHLINHSLLRMELHPARLPLMTHSLPDEVMCLRQLVAPLVKDVRPLQRCKERACHMERSSR